MADINPTVSVIALSESGLNSPVKGGDWQNG